MWYTEWVDFVRCMPHPDDLNSHAARINTASFSNRKELCEVVTLTDVVKNGDEFEIMEIDDHGAVTIWTREKIWCIRFENNLERLIYLPRHPPKVATSDTPAL